MNQTLRITIFILTAPIWIPTIFIYFGVMLGITIVDDAIENYLS